MQQALRPSNEITRYHSPSEPLLEETPPKLSLVQYVKSQPEHISQYYTQLNCLIPAGEIYQAMKTTSKIFMATDGGAVKYKGSIGCILTTKTGQELLSCYGQPAGHDSLSF